MCSGPWGAASPAVCGPLCHLAALQPPGRSARPTWELGGVVVGASRLDLGNGRGRAAARHLVPRDSFQALSLSRAEWACWWGLAGTHPTHMQTHTHTQRGHVAAPGRAFSLTKHGARLPSPASASEGICVGVWCQGQGIQASWVGTTPLGPQLLTHQRWQSSPCNQDAPTTRVVSTHVPCVFCFLKPLRIFSSPEPHSPP